MVSDTPASFGLVVLFDTVTILSFVLIVIIVATAYLSKYVQRRRVWYGQMVQWMIYCISYMLLFRFQRDTEPPRLLCLLQASFIYACPPACAAGSACFMIDFYMSLSPLHRKPTQRIRRLGLLLNSLPWVVLVSAALQVVLFAVATGDRDIAQRSHFFCNISNQEPTVVSVILVLLALVVWFFFEVQSGIILYQNRLDFKRMNYKMSLDYVSLYIRSAIFTVGMLIAIGLSIYSLSLPPQSGPWSIALPFMPIFVAVVFGSQGDIMRVWVFWRKRKAVEEEEEPSFTSQLALTFDDFFPQKSIQML
ncbi:hypothetical protein P691DRAFT_776575 [Macrolepiota fuliginosa MF-IS2]|uniref:Uncharacterized protein n=1 Tax=Macrolepiota fuliginosa MF-IS2 TaxID=1400762 RepID=A0A9P5X9Y7_9AGAR|nr:hypothetical protein P691DRAFT_776575 [Macrolepiota fuliginosa MF-IS2]